jgi:two-component system, NarL family, nitrate/nitrite response regulator NarL
VSLRVLVLEDDPFTRLSVVSALRHFGFDVVAEEALPQEALERAQLTRPEVALLDLHLGKGATGLDVAKELRRNNPKIGIVMLTSFEDPRLLSPSLPPIPRGSVYLTKRSVQNLVLLKTAVLEAAEKATTNSGKEHLQAFGQLSDVQIETLRLVAQGLSNSEIAKRRFVKEKSVELTISRVAKSLGIVSNNTLNQRVHIARVYFRSTGVMHDVSEN